MASRRVLPLIAAVAAGSLALALRLHRVQIVEGAIWRAEAASLVRSGAVRPYRRGSIRDAQGREIARDERVYEVEFRYRDFRRGHPLGQVAHARAALTGEPIALPDALDHLREWAGELIDLTPAALERFAGGGALATASFAVAETDDAEREARRERRADARYYVARLFELDRDASRALSQLSKAESGASFAALAARVVGRGEDEVRTALFEHLERSVLDLDYLALALAADGALTLPPGADAGAAPPRAALLEALEHWRAAVEDGAATALASEALGFSPGRVDALCERADLRWLACELSWNGARLATWHARARAKWLEQTATFEVERMLSEVEMAALDAPLVQRTLRQWALAYASPRATEASDDWREWRDLAVADEIEAAFEAGRELARPPALPFQDAEALGRGVADADDWRWLARAELWQPAAPHFDAAAVEELARAWQGAFADGLDRDFWRERTRSVLARWDALLQGEVAARLDALREEPARPLALAGERLDRARERASFVLKDRGSRPIEVVARPSYATVHVLERFAPRFAGFSVADASERVALATGRGTREAGMLVGDVRPPTLREELAERELRGEFARLRAKSDRSDDEERELLWIARRLARPDEERGRSGLEAYLDRELAGRNGYREIAGLQELIEERARVDLAPEDGADAWLTLDLDLQRAARECLESPAADPDPAQRDTAWLARPAGAIVLLSAEGDVLAAASYPDFDRSEEGRASPADLPYERCFRKPTFQPPGSVFKPFVAAWALDHAGLDPRAVRECHMLDDGQGAGYVDVRCASHHGHGAVDLHAALVRSCNSYFAWAGERLEPDDWRALAREFGFGEPTGVRSLGARSGLLEDAVPKLFAREPKGRERRLAGNGLAVVEATPAQIARATAALATGRLPDLRLIARVGEREVERRSRPLAITGASLDLVRRAMLACANEPGGSAQPALDAHELGFRMCAKTGSGDIGAAATSSEGVRGRVRKHTWLAGWFPAEEPRAVLVVYLHDTLATAGHSSIWVARQFLQRPEVRAWLAAQEAQR